MDRKNELKITSPPLPHCYTRISFSQLASPVAFAREKGCEATRLHLSTDPMPGGPVTSDLQLICLHPPELCAWTAHARVRGRVTLAVPLPVCKEGIYWPIHLSTCGHAVLTINEYPRLEGLQITIYYDCGDACVGLLQPGQRRS